eukprot:1765985-Prymnesium_polylepis.1
MGEDADLGRLADVNHVRGNDEAYVVDEEADAGRPADVNHIRGLPCLRTLTEVQKCARRRSRPPRSLEHAICPRTRT